MLTASPTANSYGLCVSMTATCSGAFAAAMASSCPTAGAVATGYLPLYAPTAAAVTTACQAYTSTMNAVVDSLSVCNTNACNNPAGTPAAKTSSAAAAPVRNKVL